MFKFIRNQQGESVFTLPVLILIICMVLYLGIDVFGIYVTNQKLRLIASETLTVMKMQNGWKNDSTDEFFEETANKVGLAPNVISIDEVTYSSDAESEMINRGDPVTLALSTPYQVRALKPLGQTITFNIRVRLTGVAQQFKQPGG